MIHVVAETGSTNADLLDALRRGERAGEGDWLVAERQAAGRGRQGREWFDGHGNFMGSTVVRLSPCDPSPPTLALVAGLAAYEAVSRLLADPSRLRLKWPNDLMIGSAKLAGILLEREGQAIVVGMGVNLAAAPDLPDRETVALSAFGPSPDRVLFAEAIAAAFALELDRWRNYGLDPILRRWECVAHPIGTPLVAGSPGENPFSGTFGGLTEDGSLKLRLADGQSRVIHAGDVMIAKPE